MSTTTEVAQTSWWNRYRKRPTPGLPLVVAILFAVGTVPVAALVRQPWVPYWLGYGLLTLVMSAVFGSFVLSIFVFLARPTTRQAIAMACFGIALPVLALLMSAIRSGLVGGAISAVSVLDFAFVVAGLVMGLVHLVGRLVTAFTNRALSRRGRPSLDESIEAWMAGVSPTERAAAVAATMGAVWLLISWMFQLGGTSDTGPARLLTGVVDWLVPIADAIAVTALASGLLVVLAQYAQRPADEQTTPDLSGTENQSTVEPTPTLAQPDAPTADAGSHDPPWLLRLRPAARQRPRTQYVQVRWHDLQQLLQRHDVLVEAARPEHQRIVEALAEQDYGRP